MNKEEFYKITTIEKLVRISEFLSDDERDIFKYRISKLCIEELEEEYNLGTSPEQLHRFNIALEALHKIQPYSNRIPRYGIAYKGRPKFMTDELLSNLKLESETLRTKSIINIDQFITCAETENKDSHAEKLEDLKEFNDFVEKCVGPIKPSYISNYIYYDEPGNCSKPHVDNGFTSITVMIALKHDSIGPKKSFSFAYWPNLPRFDYFLTPGEIAIFFGAGVLHGRTPVEVGESVNSLLLSFRPLL